MGNLCDDTPKPMLEIGGRPKLAYTIEMLPSEIDEVILVVGYLGEQIREYFGDSFAGRKISYIAQTELNGTDGAVRLAQRLIKGKFLVLMGDDLYRSDDIAQLIENDFALLAMKTDEAEQFGLVSVDDVGNLRAVVERPHGQSSGLINIGAYVLSPDYFDIPPVAISDSEYGLPQTLAQFAQNRSVKVITAKGWMAIGNPEDLKLAQKRMGEFCS